MVASAGSAGAGVGAGSGSSKQGSDWLRAGPAGKHTTTVEGSSAERGRARDEVSSRVRSGRRREGLGPLEPLGPGSAMVLAPFKLVSTQSTCSGR